MVKFSLIVAAVTCLAGVVLSKTRPEPKPYICDRIYIVGNFRTPDWRIHECLTFSRGKAFSHEDLRASQQKLLKLFEEEVETDAGTKVRIMGNPRERGLQDVLVIVREKF